MMIINNNNNNNKIWILFAMSAYSFNELKFTSTWEKQKENNKQKHQNLQCIIFLNSKKKGKLTFLKGDHPLNSFHFLTPRLCSVQRIQLY